MNKLIKQQRKIYYPLIKSTGRRIATIIIAAVMLGGITAVAYEPIRDAIKGFFVTKFSTHDEIHVEGTPSELELNESYSMPLIIETEYEISVPDGFELTDYFSDDNLINCRYYKDKDFIYFEQYPAITYSASYDNEHHIRYNYTDDTGQEYLVYKSTKSRSIAFIWNNGEYVFEVASNLSKSETLDICHSLKIKEDKNN